MAKPLQGQRWNLTANEISSETEKLLQESRSVYDIVADVGIKDVTFDNVVKPLADMDSSFAVLR